MENINDDRSDLKNVWQIELDILDAIDAICKKNNIKYFAISGTLLGAIRHKGFIPWDDDIDLVMLPNDYFKFIECAQKELTTPLSLQSYKYTKEAGANVTRIRNSNTTGCTLWEKNNINFPNYNLGIFVDIFPLFYVPSSKRKWERMKKRIHFYRNIMSGYENYRARKNDIKKRKLGKRGLLWLLISPFISYQKLKEKFIKFCSKENGESGLVCALTNLTTNNMIWKKEWFEKTLNFPFENKSIPVPFKYDDILSCQYGDWRTPKQKGAYHEMAIVDPFTPFSVKIKDY